MRSLLVLVLMSALLIGRSAAAEEQKTGVAEMVVGPWRLVEWVVTDQAGEQVYPFGKSAEGLLIYTANGRMSVQLTNPDLSVGESDDASEPFEDIVARFFAYYGTYSIDEAAMTITHAISGSVARSWIGSDQVREFELLDENWIRLTARLASDDPGAPSGSGGTNVLIWDRISD